MASVLPPAGYLLAAATVNEASAAKHPQRSIRNHVCVQCTPACTRGAGAARGDAFFMLAVFYFGLTLMVVLLKKPAGLLSEPAH